MLSSSKQWVYEATGAELEYLPSSLCYSVIYFGFLARAGVRVCALRQAQSTNMAASTGPVKCMRPRSQLCGQPVQIAFPNIYRTRSSGRCIARKVAPIEIPAVPLVYAYSRTFSIFLAFFFFAPGCSLFALHNVH
jgi:hypothetical protein